MIIENTKEEYTEYCERCEEELTLENSRLGPIRFCLTCSDFLDGTDRRVTEEHTDASTPIEQSMFGGESIFELDQAWESESIPVEAR